MLYPKKVKYRKWQKAAGVSRAPASRRTKLSFGDYGLKSLGAVWITARQIEAARRVLVRAMLKGGKVWIRVFPDKPVTKKGSEVPMGGGKGPVDHYVAPVRAGTILFELTGVKEEEARRVVKLASHKLPVKTKFVKR